MSELAYDYRTCCSIMLDRGFTMAEIEAFLIAHQNASGYIKASEIPSR
jgi:hypothetical protein